MYKFCTNQMKWHCNTIWILQSYIVIRITIIFVDNTNYVCMLEVYYITLFQFLSQQISFTTQTKYLGNNVVVRINGNINNGGTTTLEIPSAF